MSRPQRSLTMSLKYSCCYCKESFVFKKTLELHKEKVHVNPSLDTSVTSLSDILSSELGQNITLAIDNDESVVKEKKKQAEKKSKIPPISLSGGKKRKRASKCLTCGLTTEDYPLLLSHQMLEHGAKTVPVHYCGYSGCWFPFGTRLEKTDHEKNRHGSVIDVFVCIICKKRYPSSSQQYITHVKSCAKKMVYKCPCGPPCSFETRKYGAMRRHVKSIHNKLLESFPKSTFEVRSPFVGHQDEQVQDEDDIKQEPADVKPAFCDLGESPNAEQLKQEDDKSDDDVILCPFDSRKFSKIPDLHKHVHTHHLDIGDDSIDCPFCEEVWTCFCGRQTNNRDSLVLHSLRCDIIRSSGHVFQAVTTVSDTGSLRANRRAAKKFKELGFKDKMSLDEVLKSDQMKMVESISQSPQSDGSKTEPPIEKLKEEVIDIASDSDSDENNIPNLSAAKRKSKETVLSPVFAKCRDCDKVYHKTMIAAHECAESESESEGIADLSD